LALWAVKACRAKSTGMWTLCEGRDPASHCQTVNGEAAKLKIEPAIVRPGVDAVALYEKPGLQGRRVVYSFGSDIPPPFKAKSARTWGGAWSLCDAAGKCQVIDSESPVAVDIRVGVVKPGGEPPASREPERLQLALAQEPPAPAEPNPIDSLADEAVKTPPAPRAAPAHVEIAAAATTSQDALQPPPDEATPAAVADAAQSAQAREAPYVDVPVPPRASSPPATPREEPDAGPIEPRRAPTPVRPILRVSYSCADGGAMTVVFDNGGRTAIVTVEGERPEAMQRAQGAGGGGFFYEGEGHVLFGAGSRAGYASDGAEPVECYLRSGARRLSAMQDDGSYYPGRLRQRQYDSYAPPSDEDDNRSW
jgi:hypothetical protein